MSYEAWGEPEDSPFDAAIEAGWIDPTDLSKATRDVMNERDRQWNEEGWTPEHDDKHVNGEMARAAAGYAFHAGLSDEWRAKGLPQGWPAGWAFSWWKPTSRRRDLVKAAALILAEIERLDRADARAAAQARGGDHG